MLDLGWSLTQNSFKTLGCQYMVKITSRDKQGIECQMLLALLEGDLVWVCLYAYIKMLLLNLFVDSKELSHVCYAFNIVLIC